MTCKEVAWPKNEAEHKALLDVMAEHNARHGIPLACDASQSAEHFYMRWISPEDLQRARAGAGK